MDTPKNHQEYLDQLKRDRAEALLANVKPTKARANATNKRDDNSGIDKRLLASSYEWAPALASNVLAANIQQRDAERE